MSASGPKRTWLIVLVVIAVAIGIFGWYKLMREVPQPRFDRVEDQFKYGSIGAEDAQGIPFWIWFVLPNLFPEYLPGPGGYASLGLPSEPGHDTPIGLSKKKIGFDRVAINCAFCHTATVREAPDQPPTIYLGGPSHAFDVLAYQRFLFNSASDPRFTSGNVMRAITRVYDMPLIDRLLYRFVLIGATRKALLEQKEQFAWTDSRPDWGRGRIDPFNPVKVAILDQPVGDTIGNSDTVPIWNLRPRQGMEYHWDGLNAKIEEVFRSSAIGDGATPKSISLDDLQRLQDWLMDLEPPAYPFPIDEELAAAGGPVYEQHCAKCHAFGGERTGKVEPLEEVGTDPHRVEMWTQESADAYNAYSASYPWAFTGFKAPNGYVNVPLDGLWIRAPYLHNGSVPYLDELLETPDKRTAVFYRGFEVYNPERVGFISEGELAERHGWRLDTSEAGNSNAGHLWGTDLPAEDKRALLEYLKSL